MSNKQGDRIVVSGEQFDANDDCIMKMHIEWMGFQNADANEKVMELVGGITALAETWRQEKASRGANVPEQRQEYVR